MTDKIIVSKSEIENFILEIKNNNHPEYCWSWTNTEISYLAGKLQNIIDNAQVVNSELVCYVSKRTFDSAMASACGIGVKGISREKLLNDDVALFTTPQPAPDTVPRAEYDKLLEAFRNNVGEKDRAGWLGGYCDF